MAPALRALPLAAELPAAAAFRRPGPGRSLRHHVVHKLHGVDAESKQVEGRALVKADGTVQVMLRAPVASFRSGDSNRDSHMEEVREAGRFPVVTFRGRWRRVDATPATPSLPRGGLRAHFHTLSHLRGCRLSPPALCSSSTAPAGPARTRGPWSCDLASAKS